MRKKHLITALAAASAVALSGCSSVLDGSASADAHLHTKKLNSRQKAVAGTWYDVVPSAEKKRLHDLSDSELLQAVGALSLLCLVDENTRATQLAKKPSKMSKGGAKRLAHSITVNLCDQVKKPTLSPNSPTPLHAMVPLPAASPAPKGTAKVTAKTSDNPSHDLTKPTSRHDREDMTLRVPAERKAPAARPAPAVPRAVPPAPALRPPSRISR